MKSWFNMSAKNGTAEIDIFDEIGMFGISAAVFKAQFDDLGDIKNIGIKMNSPGGDVIDGFAIYNLLNESKANVEVVIYGYAASIASVIAMAADKITMHENTFMMIHNPWMYTMGSSEDLRKDADLLDKMKANAITAYRTHAKDLSDDDISKFMDDESWFTAKDAKTYGLSEETLEPLEMKNSINFGKLKLPENVVKSLSPQKFVNKIIKNQIPEGGKGDSMNVCPKCGKEVASGAQFCSHCGVSMKVDNTAMAVAHAQEVAEAKAETAKQIKLKTKEIMARCRNFNLPEDFETSLIESDEPLDRCIVKILDEIQKKDGNKTTPPAPGSDTKVTKDAAEKFRLGAVKSLAVATRLERKAEVIQDVAKEDLPRNLHALVRACLRNEGKVSVNRIDNMLPHDIATEAFRMAAAGTSDFPAILADVANKSLLAGYTEAPVSYDQWCGEGEVPDFKSLNLVKMSNFSDIDDIPEGFGFKEGKFTDNKETVSVDTKGKKFSLTRQALVNDDLNAFVRIPAAMMSSVRRRINKDVYDKLTFNTLVGPQMSDGYALFNATYHYNLIDPSNVPSITTIDAAEQKLMNMPLPKPDKTSDTQYANIPARYIISGTKNRLGILQVIGTPNQAIVADSTAVNPQTVNPYRGQLQLITDAYLQSRLTAASKDYAWYLAADQNVMESFAVYYLSGNRVPQMRNEPSRIGEVLGISWDIFMDWGIALVDHRGIIYNDGAAS